MMDQQSPQGEKAVALVTDGAVNAAAVAMGLVDPAAGVAAAASVPAVRAGLASVFSRLRGARENRVAVVVRGAASMSSIDPEELLRRLEQSVQRRELMLNTLNAAVDAGSERKLIALAISLHRGVEEHEAGPVSVESAIARAISGVDEADLSILERFGQTPSDLGLGTEAYLAVSALNEKQAEMVFGDDPLVGVSFARLEREALVRRKDGSSGALGGGGPVLSHWSLSPFGEAMLARLTAVAEVLAAE